VQVRQLALNQKGLAVVMVLILSHHSSSPPAMPTACDALCNASSSLFASA
jgi:hypothetical protein